MAGHVAIARNRQSLTRVLAADVAMEELGGQFTFSVQAARRFGTMWRRKK